MIFYELQELKIGIVLTFLKRINTAYDFVITKSSEAVSSLR
jgi:hypothetical protein